MPSIGPSAAACSSRSSTSRSGAGVDHALRRRQRRLAARQQPAAPAQRAPHQVAQVDAEHLVDAEVAPHLGQLVELLDERLLPRGEERRVDAAGRDAGQDVGDRCRKLPREIFAARRPDTRRARRRRSGRGPSPWDWSAVAHRDANSTGLGTWDHGARAAHAPTVRAAFSSNRP